MFLLRTRLSIHDSFYSSIREYIQEHTDHKDISCFYTLMASTQSHIDVKGEKFLKTFNLFNQLEFVRGLLFANSVPNKKFKHKYIDFPENTWCIRDLLWYEQGLPNTGIIERDFESIDELTEHYAGLKLFVRNTGDGLETFEPITINEYFEDESRMSEGLACFRSFEHVVLNNYHALEVRSDCTQPLSNAFSPLAFNLGMSEKVDKALELIAKFKKDNKLDYDNRKLRDFAIYGKDFVNPENLKHFLLSIYELAYEGLKQRNYGEE